MSQPSSSNDDMNAIAVNVDRIWESIHHLPADDRLAIAQSLCERAVAAKTDDAKRKASVVPGGGGHPHEAKRPKAQADSDAPLVLQTLPELVKDNIEDFLSFDCLSFHDLIKLSRLGSPMLRRCAIEHATEKLNASELGRALLQQHSEEFSILKLYICMEACPHQGGQIWTLLGGERVTREHARRARGVYDQVAVPGHVSESDLRGYGVAHRFLDVEKIEGTVLYCRPQRVNFDDDSYLPVWPISLPRLIRYLPRHRVLEWIGKTKRNEHQYQKNLKDPNMNISYDPKFAWQLTTAVPQTYYCH